MPQLDLKNAEGQHKLRVETLERYTGSKVEDFQPYILLANFDAYVEHFAAINDEECCRGSAMNVCHSKDKGVSIINFGVGSPVAALIIELLSAVQPKAVLMLGLCGGLRPEYKVGDYFNPVAAIREEGTSFAYLPERCPSLSSFVIQRYVCSVLEKNEHTYHTGVIHTTNLRMWEYKPDFIASLEEEYSQAIDMECATLFTVGFVCKVPVGAMTLISDLPLESDGVKTKESSKIILEQYSDIHVGLGLKVFAAMQKDEGDGFSYNF